MTSTIDIASAVALARSVGADTNRARAGIGIPSGTSLSFAGSLSTNRANTRAISISYVASRACLSRAVACAGGGIDSTAVSEARRVGRANAKAVCVRDLDIWRAVYVSAVTAAGGAVLNEVAAAAVVLSRIALAAAN